jgi:hypothetical protein
MYIGVLCQRKGKFLIKEGGFNREQRIFIVKHYFCNKSYALCPEAFQEAFPNDMVRTKTIHHITKFEETSSACDRKHNLLHGHE